MRRPTEEMALDMPLMKPIQGDEATGGEAGSTKFGGR
jgi:hypothetical protein